MPKVAKERPRHKASLAAQLQNDRDSSVPSSNRAKRKRKAAEAGEDGADKTGEQIIGGKLGNQILTMARQQLEEEEEEKGEDNNESGDEDMKWREAQGYIVH